MLIKSNFKSGQLTIEQAAKVMIVFLETYCHNTSLTVQEFGVEPFINDVAVLLEDLKVDRGAIGNSVMWQNWLISIKQVDLQYQDGDTLEILTVYHAIKHFLTNYSKKTVSEDVDMLLSQMNIIDSWMNSLWLVINESKL